MLKINNSMKITGAVLAGIGTFCALRSKLINLKEQRYLRKLVSEKQLQRKQQLSDLKGKYSKKPENYNEILTLSLEDLIESLQSRKLTATQVLEVYTIKAIEDTEKYNCITEFVPYAFDLAKELDGLSEVKGILHGIPFCVKDDTNIKGIDSTVGYARNIFKPANESAVIIQTLEDLGAIPFCRTNLPQTCISFSSENPIFGKTVNPLNVALSPGGSSSGTGALVAAGGSPFGIGSDTGGSARLPAHFCGISTLKPSKNRVSWKGCLQCLQHCVGLTTTPCFLAPKAKNVALIFKATTEHNQQNSYDGKAVPIPWRAEVFESSSKLRIGYFSSFDVFPPLGDIPETILKAKSQLEGLGHTLIPFNIPIGHEVLKLFGQLSGADMGSHAVRLLKNDQKSPEMERYYRANDLATWKRQLFSVLPQWMTGENRNVHKSNLRMKKSTNLWDCMAERKNLIEKLLKDMKAENLDLIICPVSAVPAIDVDEVRNIRKAAVYTFVWNLVDFPAGVVKVGIESGKNIDSYNDKSCSQKKVAKQCIRKSIGMPIGVHVVGKPFQEEMVLRVMVELENSLI